MSALTVGSLIGKQPPRSGALAPPEKAVSTRPPTRGPTGSKPAASQCCGSGCAGCPFFWGPAGAPG